MADGNSDWRREDDDEGEQEIDETRVNVGVAAGLGLEEGRSRQPVGSGPEGRLPPHGAAHHLQSQGHDGNPSFGTEKTKFQTDGNGRGGLGYPNCYLFTDLDVPSADDVKALKSLVEDGEDEDEVLTPSAEGASMSNVLFCANQIFTTKAANFGSRRLFIITDNDNPHPSDKAAASAAAVRAKDLYDLGVTIELFPITRGEATFDLAKFYDDIVYRDPLAEANLSTISVSKSGDGLSLLGSLTSNINSKQTPKRALFSNLPFEIAPGLRISVKGYNVLHRQTPARTCYIWLDGDKPQIAAGETTRIAEDSTRTVEKSEVKKAYKFGGEYVYFSPEEQKSLRDFGPPVIRIIGFKQRSLLPFWAAVKKSTFIFPSEEDYVGSTRVFTALWQKLVKDDKVGLAWVVVQQLQLPKGMYNPAKYPNPALQWHYQILKALALEEEVPDEPDDATKPKSKAMSKRAGGYMQEWHEQLEEEAKKVASTKALKREADDDGDSERPAKQRKTASEKPNASSMTVAQLKAAVESEGIVKMTVAQLKDVAGAKGLSTSGKKMELIERIEQWVEENT
ncbi:hypothetical protein ACCO45_010905 [Purpureocillium lilacinum]|uniref:Uncharacterized protein n=1 Tax=Purpureocillium lilacinum TaxID=33203 RepID=A0ACC4DG49_PURLI